MKKFTTLFFATFFSLQMMAQTVNLSTYVRIGRYDLPEPTRTDHPSNSLLAQEVSAVTYNWDTQTLFVVGDGGTSVVQVSKTGQLINSMTLAPGTSPQNTEFYDPEGLTYIGNDQFVMTEERDRQAVLFTYVAGGILTRANAKTVKLGTFVQNIGLEGVTYDPLTGGYIFVKETQPEGIFQTGIDFNAGTATNGSATTENSINLFDPALAGLADFADVFALSNLPALNGQPNYGNLLVLSQESGKIVNIDRSGNISSSLTILSDPGNPLDVAAQQHEGLTMDRDGILYVVSENGGGDFDHPQLWVYAPSSTLNQAPTAITLNNAVTSIAENTSTLSPLKVADIVITDDGQGANNLTISGPDAAYFQITNAGLFIKAGTVLDFENKTSYSITVNLDDTTVGSTPDATTSYTLTVTDIAVETPSVPTVTISEVAPWSSGNSPVAADWFEVTNNGSTALNISGWKMDDNSNVFVNAVALNGITNIAPGESVIFLETATPTTTIPSFLSTWFGANPPAGLQVGSYTGSGVGLSTGGDAVNLFDSAGTLQAKITFGTSPAGPFPTFNNAAGLNNTAISHLSVAGVNGAFAAVNDAAEIGSPGTTGKLIITEVAPWSSGNSSVGADWFEITNNKAVAVDITGWKVDDNSGSAAAAVALNGITSIAPGESVIFIETATPATTIPTFLSTWFGATPPPNLKVGSYTGGGVGLGTGGDAVNLYNSTGILQASVLFGASSAAAPFRTFDNAAGLNAVTISTLSQVGLNGAVIAKNDSNEIGSPGRIINCVITTSTTNVTADNSYLWNGVTYTSSGTYTATLVNAAGCDSIATLVLQINKVNLPPTVGIISPVNPAEISAGSSITIEVAANDPDGIITKTELLVNGTVYLTDSAAPYSFSIPASVVEPGIYTVTARATDSSGAVTVSDSVMVTVSGCIGSGSITGEGYTNITGSQVTDLTASASYPNNPSVTVLLNTFEYRNMADEYGARLRGYFCAPVTGLYRFSIAADDQAGLWLSTDADPAHKSLIAYAESATGFRQWNRFATQQSAPIQLVKGGRYYIETLHKEATGQDYLSVAVTLPGGAFEAPVQGSRLSPVITAVQRPAIGAEAFTSAMAAHSQATTNGLKVTVAPNPAPTYFKLTIVSSDAATLTLKVIDASGRVVETRSGIPSSGTITIGDKLNAGVYFVEISQGTQKQRLKLIKLVP